MSPTRADTRPDAIRSPLTHAGTGDVTTRLGRLQKEFSEVLGGPRVFVRNQGPEHFISCDPRDTLYHESLSPKAGLYRHDWEDRGDGVLYGYLLRDE